MTVFVVTEHIHYEGTRIIGVGETLESATLLAEAAIERMDNDRYQWGKVSDTRWNSGTVSADIDIDEYEVM